MVVVSAVAAIVLLPSSANLSQGGKPANPTVGIEPWRFTPGSAGVPFRMPNPPIPHGNGLMKGTPRIVTSVSDQEGMVCLVRASILSPANFLLPIPVVEVAVFAALHLGHQLDVTTIRAAGERQVRRSAAPFTVRRRRPAPNTARAAAAAFHTLVVIEVAVTAIMTSDVMVIGNNMVTAAAASWSRGPTLRTGIASAVGGGSTARSCEVPAIDGARTRMRPWKVTDARGDLARSLVPHLAGRGVKVIKAGGSVGHTSDVQNR